MKSLATLLKIAKRQLEGLRRALAVELARLQDVDARIAGLALAVRGERELASRDLEAALAYPAYATRARAEQGGLEAERQAIELEIERVRTLIAEAHVEARKFERLLELEAARAKAAREKREDAALDELATLRSGRAAR